ncbi:NCS1 family transporter [Rhodococcus wratislaviensis IFP 2016]|uniref:Conserved putative membrane protein n=1 Tax=Rhodococcus opacus TaxID=37919 RepID=A0A1B1KBN1_RHOOP|nr:Conserved putative membrane protein [Rhodococcus opacus]ELB86359.1 NCS1 family transporter [Rhodococcus wratislaviensis IFP 2016]CAG7583097.1 hypothetical protein E143388_01222 [Rhodococcus opacus]
MRDRVTTTQSLHRFVDQQAVDRLGDLDERNDTTQFDDGQTRLRPLLDQRRRDQRQLRPGLDGHSGDTAGRQFTHVPPQSGRVGRRECEPAGQQQLAAAKKVRDVNWTTMGCFVAGIAATWLFMYGATSLTQGFAARALGGLDLSWLAGGGVAAALYSVLGPRAHRPYRITGQPPTRSSATTDSPDVLAGN